MKTKLTSKTMILSAAILLVGAVVAFAHGGTWSSGYGGHMMGYGPQGYGMEPGMMYGPQGRNYRGNLTDEQRDKIEASQEKFYNDTRKLRDQIQNQQYALQKELAKESPDEAKIGTLQKDLSKLEGEFDQKAVQHQLELRKLLPENTRQDFGRGYGGGYCWR
jgi:Spy/CpxP family protein refolding chaperone